MTSSLKIQHTKNTLLKNAQANAKAIFLREYFFSCPKRNSKNFFPTLRCFNFFCQRTVQTWADIASNVNRFGQSVCGLETVVLRGKSTTNASPAQFFVTVFGPPDICTLACLFLRAPKSKTGLITKPHPKIKKI